MINRRIFILICTLAALLGVCLFNPHLKAGDEMLLNLVTQTNDSRHTLSGIHLEDQFGGAHDYSFPRAAPMVLLVADKKGNDALVGWIKELRTPLAGQIPMVGVADVRGVPGLFQAKVKRKFRAAQKHPVLMDWEGAVLITLNPVKGVPNAYLISRKGNVLLHLSGEATTAKIDEMLNQLEFELTP